VLLPAAARGPHRHGVARLQVADVDRVGHVVFDCRHRRMPLLAPVAGAAGVLVERAVHHLALIGREEDGPRIDVDDDAVARDLDAQVRQSVAVDVVVGDRADVGGVLDRGRARGRALLAHCALELPAVRGVTGEHDRGRGLRVRLRVVGLRDPLVVELLERPDGLESLDHLRRLRELRAADADADVPVTAVALGTDDVDRTVRVVDGTPLADPHVRLPCVRERRHVMTGVREGAANTDPTATDGIRAAGAVHGLALVDGDDDVVCRLDLLDLLDRLADDLHVNVSRRCRVAGGVLRDRLGRGLHLTGTARVGERGARRGCRPAPHEEGDGDDQLQVLFGHSITSFKGNRGLQRGHALVAQDGRDNPNDNLLIII
jgi:hypothetical protein